MKNLNLFSYKASEKKIEFSQTSKGYWYCSNLPVYNDDPRVCVDDAVELMFLIKKKLFEVNNNEESICDEKGK